MSRFPDTGLPGLEAALDPSVVGDLLRRALPEIREGLEITGVHLMDVRYQHDGPCWILYRLKLRPGRGRSIHQLLSARVLRAGERPEPVPEELQARFREREGSLLRTPTAYIPEAHMAVYAYPLDPALPKLIDAMDGDVVRKHLNRLWAPQGVHVREVRPRKLGYTPHARAAFRYEVLAERRDTGVPEIRRLIGKLHGKKAAHRLFAGNWALWRAAGKKVNLAPPVGYIGALGLTLQEEIRGERLGGFASDIRFTKRARQTGRMLAAMHGLSLPLTTRRRPEDEAHVVLRWAGVLAAVRPDLGPRVERLRDRLVAMLLAETRMSAPVHGDFHHTNILVQDDRVAIIDLDEMAFGDPMMDVGRFLASLRIPSLRAFGKASGLEKAGEAFLLEYRARSGADMERARLFEAASLMTAAASSFRIQRPSWAEEIEVLLRESERVLEARGAAPVAPTPPIPPPGPVPDRDRWARDPVYMQAVLDPHVRKVYGIEVEGCRVAAEPAGRPDRIRYVVKGRHRGEKRTVTLQGLAWRLHGGRALIGKLDALRTAIEGSPGGPILPRPVAYIRPLSLLVWEAPSGQRFSSMLGKEGELDAAARVGKAIAALHQVNVQLESSRSVEDELRSLRSKVERLRDRSPAVFARAMQLLGTVEARSRSAAPMRGPIIRTVHPHHVLVGDRVALAKIEDITLSHPLIDAGDFLARLAVMGLDAERSAEASRAADCFRRSYREEAGATEADMAAFEAGALLRFACIQAREAPGNGGPERLLDQAAERLS